MKTKDLGIRARRKELLAAHTGSYINGDINGMVEAKARITEFNRDHASVVIDKSAIFASIEGARKRALESDSGVNLDPRLRARLLATEALGGTPIPK